MNNNIRMDTIGKRALVIWLYVREINREIFKVSFVTYFLLYLIDDMWPRIVSDYYNLNTILVIIFFSGLIVVIFPLKQRSQDFSVLKPKNIILIACLGIGIALLVYYRIRDIGTLAVIISIVIGLVTSIVSIALLHDFSHTNKE